MVKEIIEKPEDRWRILWQKTRATAAASSDNCETASTGSSVSNVSSFLQQPPNMVQPGVPEGGDPLSMVKVTSAKQWKAISRKLTINLDGITLGKDDGDDDPMPRPETPSDFKPTTVQQLQLICWRIKPWEQPRARNLFSSIFAYREFQLLANLGWIDFDLGCSTILLGQ